VALSGGRGQAGRARRGRQARARRGLAAGRVRVLAVGGRAGVRASGLARNIYSVMPCHGSRRTCHVTFTETGRRHVRPLLRHHAWRGTGIWPRQGNRRGQKC